MFLGEGYEFRITLSTCLLQQWTDWIKARFRLSVSFIQFRFVVIDGHWYYVCTELARVCFQHVYCEANSLANDLAKGGVERSSWFRVLGS
ncbi:hypothetical protein GQ457_13G025890 [Hibiscus cannabinus]